MPTATGPSRSRPRLIALLLVLTTAGGTYLTTRSLERASAPETRESQRDPSPSVRASPTRQTRAAALETATLSGRLARLEQRVSAAELAHAEVAAETPAPAAETVPDDAPGETRRAAGTPNQIHEALEATWTDEPTDTAWSRQEERAIAAALGTSRAATVAHRIECRSSMCKVALGFQDSDARARFETEQLGRAPFDRGVFIHNDNEVGTEVSLYAMRDVPRAPE